jgi:hypothetical protein
MLILRALERFETDLQQGRDPMNRWLDIRADGDIRVTELPAAN